MTQEALKKSAFIIGEWVTREIEKIVYLKPSKHFLFLCKAPAPVYKVSYGNQIETTSDTDDVQETNDGGGQFYR